MIGRGGRLLETLGEVKVNEREIKGGKWMLMTWIKGEKEVAGMNARGWGLWKLG